MTGTGGICRVCGTALAPPLVACPRCETPHHRDCWDYNGGCSTYGCLEHLPTAVSDVAPAVETVSGADLYFDLDPRSNPAIAVVIALGVLKLTPPLFLPLAVAGAVAYGYAVARRLAARRASAGEAARATEGESESVKLESKALTALIGAGVPHPLAQAYALFEQRHPRRARAPPMQTALALELAGAGYDVLALEAIDKGVRLPGADSAKLAARRDDLIAREPAYAMAAGAGDRPVLSSRQSAACLRHALVDEVDGDALVMLSLSPAGWSWEARDELNRYQGALPRTPGEHWFVAGPFAGEEARRMAGTMWGAGQPAVLAPAEALDVPERSVPLEGAQLSQANARLDVSGKSRVLAWSEVRAVVYGLVVDTGTDVRPVVEIVVEGQAAGGPDVAAGGDPPAERPAFRARSGQPERIRLWDPPPGPFLYLGRRTQYTVDANLKLLVKDLVRFAPQARFSHGVLGLMMERAVPGSRFEGLAHLDAYTSWFCALGHPSVVARYRGAGQSR